MGFGIHRIRQICELNAILDRASQLEARHDGTKPAPATSTTPAAPWMAAARPTASPWRSSATGSGIDARGDRRLELLRRLRVLRHQPAARLRAGGPQPGARRAAAQRQRHPGGSLLGLLPQPRQDRLHACASDPAWPARSTPRWMPAVCTTIPASVAGPPPPRGDPARGRARRRRGRGDATAARPARGAVPGLPRHPAGLRPPLEPSRAPARASTSC